ncbi:uncharacterized protein [Venturia canescens]|uniref:uncharacterized protein n=1 Tax=Venturia canescens TaxID=32260 RepID=UPI001C9D575F|nr:uncharacterized protein LOC122412769 [Venturia canescens]
MNFDEGIEFIKNDLLPEAVHNRCFCEAGSREFLEFSSVQVESLSVERSKKNAKEYFRARMIVKFSGEPKTFPLIIKLLGNATVSDRDYDEFLNEEMFYSKIVQKYKLNIYPKCYVADMGRYGRPVIVLEDLEACGYVRVDGKLDEDHLALGLKAIEGLHQRGLRLKAENYNSFREFYAKLIDTRLDTQSTSVFNETSSRLSRILKKLRCGGLEKIDLENEETLLTLCHGNLIPRECFFYKYEDKKPVEVKIIGWKRIRYCSIIVDLTFLLQDRVTDENEADKYLRIYFQGPEI